jgi:hypothetical protein
MYKSNTFATTASIGCIVERELLIESCAIFGEEPDLFVTVRNPPDSLSCRKYRKECFIMSYQQSEKPGVCSKVGPNLASAGLEFATRGKLFRVPKNQA